MPFNSRNRIRVQAGVEGVKKAVAELNGFRDAFDKVANSKGGKAIMEGIGLGAGISAWGLVTDGIAKARDVMVESVKAASDQREAMALNAQVFERNAGAVEDWARNSKDAFSSTEAVQFAAKFGTAFKSVGMNLDDVAGRAQTMVTLAGDLGSAFNTSSEDAANALRSGLMGESEPLRKFGVFLSEDAVKAKALAMGLTTAGAKMTDAQKVAARYAIIMEQTADSQGMFGRDSDSLADKTKLLETRFADIQVELGERLTPALLDAADGMISLFDAMDTEEPRDLWERFVDLAVAMSRFPGQSQANKDFWDAQKQSIADNEEATYKAALAWDTGSERLGGLNRSLDDVAGSAKVTAPRMQDLADAAKDTARWFGRTTSKASEWASVISEAAYGPAELSTQWSLTKLELKDNQDAFKTLDDQIKNLEKNGKKVPRDMRQDWLKAKSAVIDSKQALIDTGIKLEGVGGISLDALRQQFLNLGIDIANTNDQARLAWWYYTHLKGAPTTSPPATGAGGQRSANATIVDDAKADGGPVAAGRTYLVGERGPELLVMGDHAGTIVPNHAIGGAAASGQPVVVQLNLDGREIARVVDRHLYYAAAAAPMG